MCAGRPSRDTDTMKKEYDFSDGNRGPVIRPKSKTQITIYLDDDVLEALREQADASGVGYQPIINQALRDYLDCSAALSREIQEARRDFQSGRCQPATPDEILRDIENY